MAALSASELVSSLIKKHAVVVFSKTYCPYCKKAKAALTAIKAPFEAVELDTRNDGADIQNALEKLTGRRTVPNVFIAGKSIGGGDDTEALWKSGELEKLVTAANKL